MLLNTINVKRPRHFKWSKLTSFFFFQCTAMSYNSVNDFTGARLLAVIRHWDHNMHCISALHKHIQYTLSIQINITQTPSGQKILYRKSVTLFLTQEFSLAYIHSAPMLPGTLFLLDLPFLRQLLMQFSLWIDSVSRLRETVSKPLTQGLDVS